MTRRSYAQHCGLARALDVVGERWTLLIVRDLLLGPRRYSDLLAELPGITTNLLAKRLRELEAEGLIAREHQPPPQPATLYGLTPSGAALEPVVMELARWGGRFMGRPRPGDKVDIGWRLLSMKRRYKGGQSLVVGIEVDDRSFELSLEPQYLRVTDRAAQRPDLVVRASLPSLTELLFKGGDPDALKKKGLVEVVGEESALRAFLGAFLGS